MGVRRYPNLGRQEDYMSALNRRHFERRDSASVPKS